MGDLGLVSKPLFVGGSSTYSNVMCVVWKEYVLLKMVNLRSCPNDRSHVTIIIMKRARIIYLLAKCWVGLYVNFVIVCVSEILFALLMGANLKRTNRCFYVEYFCDT